jgi:hypothetical protein
MEPSGKQLAMASGGQLTFPLGRPLERITGPDVSEALALMDEGIEKRLIIFYKPFGGNALFFYDQNLTLILDVLALYRAERVIFTNQLRAPGSDLEGFSLFDQQVTMWGRPSLANRLRLTYPGGEYVFTSEYSFFAWSGNTAAIVQAQAYLQ